MIRYYGEQNVPGAPGQSFLAGGNFMGGPGSAINPEAFKRDSRQQKIYNKGMGTDNPNEREIFLRRTGPQLPMALGSPTMSPIGNVGALQGFPGPGQLSTDVISANIRGGQLGLPANFDAKYVS